MKMIKLLTLFASISLLPAGQAYYEDNAKVESLASTGRVEVLKKSEDCPRPYGDKSLKEQIGTGKDYDAICVKSIKLPSKVLSEIITAKEQELDNESDYDHRVTALHQFKQNSFDPAHLTQKDVKKLAKALGIPSSHMKDINFSAQVITKDSFERFTDSIIDADYVVEPQALKYLRKSLNNQLAMVVEINDGIELYPGGGFYVTYFIIITQDKLTFVKHSWWNS